MRLRGFQFIIREPALGADCNRQGLFLREGFGEQRFTEPRAGRIGVAICYDRHYPEYMRALGVAGADLVVVPQAGAVDEWPDGLYEAELRVAAFQNGYFVALCNRASVSDHRETVPMQV